MSEIPGAFLLKTDADMATISVPDGEGLRIIVADELTSHRRCLEVLDRVQHELPRVAAVAHAEALRREAAVARPPQVRGRVTAAARRGRSLRQAART